MRTLRAARFPAAIVACVLLVAAPATARAQQPAADGETTPAPGTRPEGLEAAGSPAAGSPAAGSPAVETPITPDADPAEVLVNANRRYEEGDFAGAVELYRSLVRRGFDDGHLHYNLGNAYLRAGELGRAIASFRRAERRLPRDEDVAANLAFARQSARDAIAPPTPPPVATTLLFWHYGLSLGELLAVTLVLNVGFWALWTVRLFRRDSELLRWTSASLLVMLLAVGGSAFAHAFFPERVAVVVPQEIDAHTGPDPASVVRFKLHAGTEVAVRDSRDDWLRIALPDGQQGWVDREHVELVAAP